MSVPVSRRAVRVLIVEDEPMIAMLMEGMLSELGFEQIFVVYDLFAARETVSSAFPDLAILDVNVGEHKVFPLAETLRAQKVPLLFSSGEPPHTFPPEWSDLPFLSKPADTFKLNAALCDMGFEPD